MKFLKESSTHVGNVRKRNEDFYGNLNEPGIPDLWVVCDGMGGHAGGDVASRLAVDAVLDYWRNNEIKDISIAMNGAVQSANIRLLEEVRDHPEYRGMGTTLVMMAFFENALWIGHVGDSRAYVFSNRHLYRLTKDHSYVQQLVDMQRISDDEAESHPEKNKILRAIGIHPEVQVEISNPIYATKDDLFILCSDGLNGMINDLEINGICLRTNKGDLEILNQRLISGALEKGGKDNITVTSVYVQESEHDQSHFVDYNPFQNFATTMIVASENSPPLKPAFWKQKEVKWIVLFLLILSIILVLVGVLKWKRDIGIVDFLERIESVLPTNDKEIPFEIQNGDSVPCKDGIFKHKKSFYKVKCVDVEDKRRLVITWLGMEDSLSTIRAKLEELCAKDTGDFLNAVKEEKMSKYLLDGSDSTSTVTKMKESFKGCIELFNQPQNMVEFFDKQK